MSDRETLTTENLTTEVNAWFFDDYLTTWVGVGNGTVGQGPDFILAYWGAPLFHGHPDGAEWLPDGAAVVGMLAAMHTRLRADGYAYTEIPDRSVRVYHRNGAAIEVIWSRCRADNSEIERLAVHFEAIRTEHGWRIAGIQSRPTQADTLADAWGGR
ncbi:MAG TPA: hypothetical protein VGH89_22315 [Pseudonocardia sp.]|jgi:hypothetical protein